MGSPSVLRDDRRLLCRAERGAETPCLGAVVVHVVGIPPGRLRSREFRRLAKGKYVSAARRPSALLDAEAALLGHPPGAFASHGTAAAVYGAPIPHDVWHHVSVKSANDRRRRHRVHSHVVPSTIRVVSVRGVRLTAPADVFVQLAARLPLVELVVVGDHLVRRGLCAPAELLSVAEASEEAHAGRAARAARFVRDGVDSPMESRCGCCWCSPASPSRW